MSIYKGTQLISGVATPIQGAKNIGQIIQSTIPLTDAGLHLLDGALIDGNGIYSALIDGNGIYSAFVDYIASIYDASASYFTTEASWQDSITNYGVCGKFVYNSTNRTVRLPKITGFIEGASGVTNLGDLTQAGLPDHTHSYIYTSKWIGTYYSNTGGGPTAQPTGTTGLASASNPIYGRSNTVQPQSVKVLYYIVIATSTKTDIEVDIDEIATDLNGKADVDLSNTNNQAKILMSGMGMPSSRHFDLVIGASGTTYTAPANGWFLAGGIPNTTGGFMEIYNATTTMSGTIVRSAQGGDGWFERQSTPVSKGDLICFNYGGLTPNFLRFIYAVGSESEGQ